MLTPSPIRAPFFEIGPKAYLHGDAVLELAQAADEAAQRHGVHVLFTPLLTDIERIASATKNLFICAPHMDPIHPGRGVADILPEALVDSGADGVLLNHAERPLLYSVLERTVRRAEEVGLASIVCASSLAEIKAVSLLAPDILVAEPSELIGSGRTSDLTYIDASNKAIRAIDPRIQVLHAAGISTEDDVYRVMIAGADGTGSSSSIAKAPDHAAIVEEMMAAVRRGYDAARQAQDSLEQTNSEETIA